MRLLFAGLAGTLLALGAASAQDATKESAPSVITGGSSNTSIGGLPASRTGDGTDTGDTVVGGSKDVFINNRPAVTTGDQSNCGGVVVGSGSNVFINGKPVARAGDLTTGCQKQ